MKKYGLLVLGCLFALSIVFVNLNATGQEYRMDKVLCEKYINLSREAVQNGNLALAQAYAKKAVQANSWDKLAWANYNDIIQQMADFGDIPQFGTVVEESQSNAGPSPTEGAPQLEGC
jgi:hypothetical protein